MLQFASPLILLALAILPVIWLLLRAVPPSPVKRAFAAVHLLLGLRDKDQVSERTPWWLLLMRILALAAIIIALAKPELRYSESRFENDRMLIILDGGFAHQKFAQHHRDQIQALLESAEVDQKLIAVLDLANPDKPDWQSAAYHAERLASWTPSPWLPSFSLGAEIILSEREKFDGVWFVDGLDYAQDRLEFLSELQQRGHVEIRAPSGNIAVLTSVIGDGDNLVASIQKSDPTMQPPEVAFIGLTPAGVRTEFARVSVSPTTDNAVVELPSELRARLTDVRLIGEDHAASVVHAAGDLARPRVGIFALNPAEEVAELLQPLHYLRTALQQTTEVIELSLDDILLSKPIAIFLTDASRSAYEQDLVDWVSDGGTLIQFAGPTTALYSQDMKGSKLLPVDLRQGGRQLGGAMTWDTPKHIADFKQGSPFFGLSVPEDIVVKAQVLAEPDVTLSSRVVAELEDGTPLVTQAPLGEGKVVFFHITANAAWSNLALSELFVEMTQRLVSGALVLDGGELPAGLIWQSTKLINHTGRLVEPEVPIITTSQDLGTIPISAELPGGIYQTDEFTFARNLGTLVGDLRRMEWPNGLAVRVGNQVSDAMPLAHFVSVFALILLALDVVASARVAGRLLIMLSLCAGLLPSDGITQTNHAVASEITFAHVLTGNARVDQMAAAGLFGLSDALFFRTSVEPSTPVGVNVEFDELAFYPFLYWPISEQALSLTPQAIERVNRYMQQGGVIVFDSRDAGLGTAQGNLRDLLRQLDIPSLDPLPNDHVINRTFYLIQDAPGRHVDGEVWVEAAINKEQLDPALPFRRLNDGVTPVIIGSNDWAAAWAINQQGDPLYPVGRGRAGEQQREMAIRFGINLVMHVLTGNYKSDQVHVPALLDRLGQ